MKKAAFVFLSSIITCLSQTTIAQVNLNQGLRAYYPFNGNANDASGNNNHPVFSNVTFTTDGKGNPNSAAHFNGINSYIQIRNNRSINFKKQMSIAIKVKPLGYYKGRCYNNMIIMKGDDDYLPGNYFIRFSDVYTGCTAPKTTEERFYGEGTVAKYPIVKLQKWYSVVWTYDGTTAKLYVDCILQEKKELNLAPLTNSYDLFIGHLNNEQYPYWLNGDLDEIRIYDRTLTQEEVNFYGECEEVPLKLDFATNVINNKKIRLNWSTSDELYVKNFVVERSETGKKNDFLVIGSLSSNKASSKNKYTFTDKSANKNKLYYYRINIINENKTEKYSEIKTAKIISTDSVEIPLPPQDVEVRINAENELNNQLPAIAVGTENIYAAYNKQTFTDSSSARDVLQRNTEIQETIYFTKDSLELSLYDNGEIDGDTVSVLLNGKLIIAKQALTGKAINQSIFIPAATDSIELIMYAENLGSIPPNTGLLIVRDGQERHEVRFSGDLKKNASIIFKRKSKTR